MPPCFKGGMEPNHHPATVGTAKVRPSVAGWQKANIRTRKRGYWQPSLCNGLRNSGRNPTSQMPNAADHRDAASA